MGLEKAKDEFLKYTENYDLSDFHIIGKQKHSIRVMELSKKIAEGLKLSEEQIELATLIGLLHDIARFEQYKQYHTFKDAESIDHGDLGVEILNKDLHKYIDKDKTVADVGTGAGFPGIPLKIYRPDLRITLVDSLNKRINFLNEVINNLKLEKINTVHSRVEDFGKDKE